MYMIWHAINSNHFMTVILNYARNVLMQTLLPIGVYNRLPELHCKNTLDMYLGKCV